MLVSHMLFDTFSSYLISSI